jgi:hypothetical protein
VRGRLAGDEPQMSANKALLKIGDHNPHTIDRILRHRPILISSNDTQSYRFSIFR